MARTVTARTIEVFTGAQGAALKFASVTVLLVRMSHPELRFWSSLLGGAEDGTAPVEGYEIRDRDGALLGVALPRGHKASRIHAEWYDPQSDDFYSAGDTSAPVITQAIARVINARRRHVGEVPHGRDLVLDPIPVVAARNRVCPFTYCFDRHCIDHGPVWATAA